MKLSMVKEMIFLLGKDRQKLPLVMGMYFLLSLLDLLGIGLIIPFFGMLLDENGVWSDMLMAYASPYFPSADVTSLIILVGLMIILIAAVKAVASAVISWKVIEFSYNQQVKLRSVMLSAFQKMDYELHLRKNSNDVITTINYLIPNFVVLLMLGLQHVGELVLAVLLGALLIWINPVAFLCILGLLLVLLYFYARFFRSWMVELGKKTNRNAELIIRFTQESVLGLNDAKLLHKNNFFHDRLVDEARQFSANQTRQHFFSLLPKYIFEFIVIVFIVLIVFISSITGLSNAELMIILSVYGVASIRLLPIARNYSSLMNRFHFHQDTIKRLTSDLNEMIGGNLDNVASDQPPTEKYQNPRQKKNAKVEQISFDAVNFTYMGSKKPVISNAQWHIAAGSAVGLIGPSGMGKSTIVKLLLGLLHPTSGTVRCNGHSIHDDVEAWWHQIALIPQTQFFIDGTLAENIALGEDKNTINYARFNNALDMADLRPIIEELPDGIHTHLSENAAVLSGGQRQRIAIARAIYFDRQILVMDESTSALDKDAEKIIIDQINKLKGQITVIYITHRESTLAHCDFVYKIEAGMISEVER